MLTRIRFVPPKLTGSWGIDGPNLLAAINNYFLVLNAKSTLEIDEARIRAAQGVAFPATAVASSDANTLDDYQEKPWVPADGSGAGLALTVNNARCTKFGRLFVLFFDVLYPATASGAAAQIGGSPYADASQAVGSLWNNGLGGADTALLTGANINFYTPAGVAITNAQLTGATVKATIVGMV